MKKCSLFFVLTILLASGCKKDEPQQPFTGPYLPPNFPQPVYDLSANPVTEAGFALGKKLFYDRLLSRDTTIACADCHISYAAFSHPDHTTSHATPTAAIGQVRSPRRSACASVRHNAPT